MGEACKSRQGFGRCFGKNCMDLGSLCIRRMNRQAWIPSRPRTPVTLELGVGDGEEACPGTPRRSWRRCANGCPAESPVGGRGPPCCGRRAMLGRRGGGRGGGLDRMRRLRRLADGGMHRIRDAPGPGRSCKLGDGEKRKLDAAMHRRFATPMTATLVCHARCRMRRCGHCRQDASDRDCGPSADHARRRHFQYLYGIMPLSNLQANLPVCL